MGDRRLVQKHGFYSDWVTLDVKSTGVEHQRNSTQTQLNNTQRQSTKVNETQRQINKTQRQSTQINENQRKSTNINENQRQPTKLNSTQAQRHSNKLNETQLDLIHSSTDAEHAGIVKYYFDYRGWVHGHCNPTATSNSTTHNECEIAIWTLR